MRALLIPFVVFAVVACGARTKTPTAGKIEVSGSCGVDNGGAVEDGSEYGYGYLTDVDHTTMTFTIEGGKLSNVALEMNDYLPDGPPNTYRGSASPSVQLVVGEWVTVPVVTRRLELAPAFAAPLDGGADFREAQPAVPVKLRVLGNDAEVQIGNSAAMKGPCAWGKHED